MTGFRATAIRVVLACLAVSAVIGVSRSTSLEATAEWVVQALLGASIGLAVARWLTPAAWFHNRLWAAALLIASAVTLPLATVVLACLVVLHHAALNRSLVVQVLPAVFGSSLMMTALAFLVRRAPTQTYASPAPHSRPPKFLDRLPPRLAGAEIYAVEAEDHYLRVHTSLGQDLILMRLGDAIGELQGVEGAQTHRSWWVAKSAVTNAERADGRATLTLKDGAEAPVSRGFAKQLRAAGWF